MNTSTKNWKTRRSSPARSSSTWRSGKARRNMCSRRTLSRLPTCTSFQCRPPPKSLSSKCLLAHPRTTPGPTRSRQRRETGRWAWKSSDNRVQNWSVEASRRRPCRRDSRIQVPTNLLSSLPTVRVPQPSPTTKPASSTRRPSPTPRHSHSRQ